MSRALLPWEDADAFAALHDAFTREHSPRGATETALVGQLAWIEWRRRRLLIGERAAHMASLQDRFSADHKTLETVRRAVAGAGDKAAKNELGEALSHLPETDAATKADNDNDETLTRRAIAILETGDPDGYVEAIKTMRADTRDWWEDIVSDDEQTHPYDEKQEGDSYLPYARNSEQLLRFLTSEVIPMIDRTSGEIARRPAIRLQAQGESLDPFRMDRILAIDERLTRQFEKTLGMLLKLKELRRPQSAP